MNATPLPIFPQLRPGNKPNSPPTGQNQDTESSAPGGPAGLYDFLFRRQSPVQGRWLSPDLAGLAAAHPDDPQSWNRYAYVANNPLALTDPTGLDFCYGGNSPYTSGGGGTGNLILLPVE